MSADPDSRTCHTPVSDSRWRPFIWSAEPKRSVNPPLTARCKYSYLFCCSFPSVSYFCPLSDSPVSAVKLLFCHRPLCNGVQRPSTAASSIRYLASLCGSAMPAQYTRFMGLLRGRPVALELSTRQLERSGSWQWQLQTFAEDTVLHYVCGSLWLCHTRRNWLLDHLAYYRCFMTIRSTNRLTYRRRRRRRRAPFISKDVSA